MSSHCVFEGVDDTLKARLRSYWEQKLARLKKLLKPYPEDLQEIRLTVSRHESQPQGERYEVHAIVMLPTGTPVAKANGRDPQVLLDHVAETLAEEIKKHKERVRREYLWKRKSHSRADLNTAEPLLQKHVEKGEQKDFFRVIRPHLDFLRDYARRELRALEIKGVLHPGELAVDEVLDEVVVRAWERWKDRPPDLSLDAWLTKLLDNALEDIRKQEPRPHVSLEESADKVMPDKVPQSNEEDQWWAPLLDEEERFSVADLTPDMEGTEPWEQLSAEEQHDQILTLLGDLPPAQRQAFLLHALEHSTPAQIAMLQNRPEGEVKDDVKAVQKMLRERLLASGYAKETGQPAAPSSVAVGEGAR